MTAVQLAVRHGRPDVVEEMVLRTGSTAVFMDVVYGGSLVTWAVKNNHVSLVKALLERGAIATVEDENGLSLRVHRIFSPLMASWHQRIFFFSSSLDCSAWREKKVSFIIFRSGCVAAKWGHGHRDITRRRFSFSMGGQKVPAVGDADTKFAKRERSVNTAGVSHLSV